MAAVAADVIKMAGMAGNVFGKLYRLSSFGESHGAAVGGMIDGCPAGIPLTEEMIQCELDRRRPGQSDISTLRSEADRVEIVSGVFEGRTTGMPIGFLVRNTGQNSLDYSHLKDIFRPSHADYTWYKKYGIRDYRGGGRSSAREHIARVVGGAVAKQVLSRYGIRVNAYTSQIGDIVLPGLYSDYDLTRTEANAVRCPDEGVAERMIGLIREVRDAGDSVGGCVTGVIRGLMPGLGEPVFDRFQARLAQAMLSINAAKGFEYGSGFAAAGMRGSAHNDSFCMKEGQVHTATNRSGGVQGGVTNGEDVYFRVAFKPVATLMTEQATVTKEGEEVRFQAHGRHDPCAVPRAVPVVEAMAAMTVLDLLLENEAGNQTGDVFSV